MTGGPPLVVGLDVAGGPDVWRAAGFAVAGDGTFRIGQVLLRCGAPGRGIASWTLAGVPPAGAVDGLPTAVADVASVATAGAGAPAEHPNGATVVDHVVVFTPDGARTTGALESLGMDLRRVKEDVRSGFPVRQSFFRAGEVLVEVVEPQQPPDDASGPAVFFGIACTVRDIDACAALLGDVLDPVRDAVQPGRRIATLRHKAIGGSTAVAFMSA